MRYSLRFMLIGVTILAIMAATLQAASPQAVLVLLMCVCGVLGWAASVSFVNRGRTRLVFGAAALGGLGYLFLYVFTNSPIEAWINGVAIAPFVWLKSGAKTSIPSAELSQLSNSMEFQYFQQKIHLVLALVTACVVGWIASS